LTSARSLKFAAEHGINGVMIAEPNDRLRRNIDIYYEAAEKVGFPDLHNRGRFKFGWDAEKRRGIMTSRYLHITRPGKEKEALDKEPRLSGVTAPRLAKHRRERRRDRLCRVFPEQFQSEVPCAPDGSNWRSCTSTRLGLLGRTRRASK
jgi:hypothetical protein